MPSLEAWTPDKQVVAERTKRGSQAWETESPHRKEVINAW